MCWKQILIFIGWKKVISHRHVIVDHKGNCEANVFLMATQTSLFMRTQAKQDAVKVKEEV